MQRQSKPTPNNSSPTEESSAKMNLITQSSNDDDAKRNLVDGEGKVADTSLPYKLPFSATKLSRSFVTFQSGVKVNTAVTKREKWLCDGNKWDDIVPDRELPCNVMYMVVDIETHDWKDGGPRNGRIVEMAWMVFDCDMKCLESKQYLLKPHGYDRITQKATACHGITTERAVDDGVDAQHVFDEFTAILNKLPSNGFVIAHNMEHEDSIFKCNLNEEQQVLWRDAPKCDTWSLQLCQYLPQEAKEKYQIHIRKFGLKLAELYSYVCPQNDNDCVKFSHMALEDVKMTWAVFLYYMKSISYNELQWKKRRVGMIPGYKKYERSLQKRKFNGC